MKNLAKNNKYFSIKRSKTLIMVLIVLMIGIILVISCNKEASELNYTDDVNTIVKSRSSGLTDLQIYNLRKDFANTLFKAVVNEPSLRTYLHTKLTLENNSDYELIYLASKNDIIRSDKTFSAILTDYASASILSMRGSNFFNEITNSIPLMTISMPNISTLGIGDWNNANIPDVTAVSNDVDYKFSLYDSSNPNGVEIVFGTTENVLDHLNRPTLTIKQSEHHYLIDSDGITSGGAFILSYLPSREFPNGDPRDPPPPSSEDCVDLLLLALDAMDQYIIDGHGFWLIEHNTLLEDYLDCLNNTEDPDDPIDPCNEPCERDCEEIDEHLVKFRIAGWGVYSNIDNQGPWGWWETTYVFHADILAASLLSNGQANPHHTKIVTRAYKKNDILNCAVTPCEGIWINLTDAEGRWYTDWVLSDVGSPYYIQWHEVDPGSTKTSIAFSFTAKFKPDTTTEISASVTVGFDITGSEQVDLGNKPTFYCDAINKLYSTGSIEYYVD